MSDKCGNCDCSDKAQCTKGNSFVLDVVQTEKSTEVMMVMEENDGKCKCGSSCSCSHCTCGSH